MAQAGLMVGLAADAAEYDADITVNAISPVAATRVLREPRPGLAPELVAPGVVFLASPRCRFSGVVLRASGGQFATATCHFNQGADFGQEPVPPEQVEAHWEQIAQE